MFLDYGFFFGLSHIVARSYGIIRINGPVDNLWHPARGDEEHTAFGGRTLMGVKIFSSVMESFLFFQDKTHELVNFEIWDFFVFIKRFGFSLI